MYDNFALTILKSNLQSTDVMLIIKVVIFVFPRDHIDLRQ